MNLVLNPNSVMYVPPLLRAARRLIYGTAIESIKNTVPLSRLAVVEMGQSPDGSDCSAEEIGEPLLNGPTEFGLRQPTPVQWTTAGNKFAEPGDLLFCVRGATAGRTNWADRRYAIGRGLAAVRGKKGLGDVTFLYHMLRDRRDALASEARGSTFMNMGKDLLNALPIPDIDFQLQTTLGKFLASIEQSTFEVDNWRGLLSNTPFADVPRVVARIEKLAAKVEEARGLRSKTVVEADAIVLTTARRLISNVNAGITKLESWIDRDRDGIQTGPFGAQLGSEDFTESGVPVITIGNVQYRGLKSQGLRYVSSEKAQQLSRYIAKEGDILFARMGTVGRCCVVPAEAEGWLFNYHLIRVALDQTLVNPRYIHWTIRVSSDVEEYLNKTIRGATRQGVNSRIVAALPCRIPSLIEQQRIITYLDDLQAKVEALKHLQAQTAVELDALLPSILDKAFKGEL